MPQATNNQLDLSFVDKTVARMGRGPEAVIGILLAMQEYYRYLPDEAVDRLAEISDISPATISGVSTFYDKFRHAPAGAHTIRVCIGTACHVKGANVVHDAFCRYLRIPEGQDTDADRTFTVEKVACLGCCTLAPAVQIDDVIYGHVAPATVGNVVDSFLRLISSRGESGPTDRTVDKAAGEIRVGIDSSSLAQGSGRVHAAMELAAASLGVPVPVTAVRCGGMCYQDPIVEIIDRAGVSTLYAHVEADDARAIAMRHFAPATLGRKITSAVSVALDRVLTDETWTPPEAYQVRSDAESMVQFLSPQRRIATADSGLSDPLDLDSYLSRGGFEALARCTRLLKPQDVIEQVSQAGLRGRGGAGYPTAAKWSHVHRAGGDEKYIVCNGDEGDPGAFMDRMLLESHPYRIIEGMAIAAYAVGAGQGVLYIREEYPLAIERVGMAIERCKDHGLLGGDGSLGMRIMRGAGAFVCGEETALIASIEGRRGTPRLRPPYPAVSGLWGKPTLVNNAETFALVPWILSHGPEQFAAMGSHHSKGTKVFALAGKVARGGLIEVPMGITIREIVQRIGGGVPDGHELKAVQIGGPSGGCVPASLADTPVDFEALGSVGAIMGSGGMVVLDDTDCMVDIALYFLKFTQNQSCGKCTFCRIGTRRMLAILERLCGGFGRQGDLQELEDLARAVIRGSLCGLGKTAPNPVLSTLQHFGDEYEAHILGRCPAGVCKALVTYSITEDCIGCTKCAQQCPADAIEPRPYEQHEIDTEKCVRCGECKQVCPVGAVRVD